MDNEIKQTQTQPAQPIRKYERMDKNIFHEITTDTYYVNFGHNNHQGNFPTYLEAIRYRDEIYEEMTRIKVDRQKRKMAIAEQKQIEEDEKRLKQLERKVYPFNLFEHLGIEDNEVSNELINRIDNFIQRYSYQNRNYDCMNLYFREGQTLEQIGSLYQISRNRVMNIISTTCRKLRYFIKNYDEEKRREIEKQEVKLIYEKLGNDLLKKRNELMKIFRQNKIYDTEMELTFGKVKIEIPSVIVDIDIEALDLSPRPYNCLIRNGVNKVDELVELTEEGLTNMQHLGQKGIEEIKTKLKDKYGLSLKKPNTL